MRAKHRFLTSMVAIIAGFGVLATIAPTADAQRAQRQSDEPAPAEGRQFSAKAGEIVNEALQFLNSDQYGQALSKLNEVLALPDLNAYERATIYQMQGSAYYNQNNYGQAIQAFENAISSGGMLPNEVPPLRLNIAQLLIANGRNAEGATMLENYINQGNQIKPQYVELLVSAWVQEENYSKALPWAERWFNQASPKERKHFDLLNFLYNNLGMKGKQADIVLQMINRYPEDKSLWETWASMLSNGGREQDAFEVNKMLYLGGAFNTEQDIMKVVQYYSFYEMPFQAAKILEREMNAGRVQKTTDRLITLSDLLRQAREYERAVPILEQAARSSGTDTVYAQLGDALYYNGQCDKAEDAFRQAINLGYNRGKAWSRIASCIYEKSQEQPRLTCDMSQAEINAAPRTVIRERAYAAFGNVPAGGSAGSDAQKWRQFIKGEEEAFINRCEFEKNAEKDLCFLKWEQAYRAQVFTAGELVMDDENCFKFQEEYESKFVKKKEQN